jgi:acyl-CoA synthetase (AMP-forming)/AMP-acid ligase II
LSDGLRLVEEVLLTHPGVQAVAVVGRPDPEWGEAVVAFIVAGAVDSHAAAVMAAGAIGGGFAGAAVARRVQPAVVRWVVVAIGVVLTGVLVYRRFG